MQLIAFYSQGQQSGKDTAAEFVREWCEANGRTYQRLAFADKMKLLCAMSLCIQPDEYAEHKDQNLIEKVDWLKLYGGIDADLDDGSGAVHMNGRDYIIALAEGARHLFGDEFWTDVCLPRGWVPPVDHTVISDLSFAQEANRVAECGGVVIEIRRPGYNKPRTRQGALDPVYIDGEIVNDGTLEQLRQKVHNLMGSLVAV